LVLKIAASCRTFERDVLGFAIPPLIQVAALLALAGAVRQKPRQDARTLRSRSPSRARVRESRNSVHTQRLRKAQIYTAVQS
jgi:hypothetical protein